MLPELRRLLANRLLTNRLLAVRRRLLAKRRLLLPGGLLAVRRWLLAERRLLAVRPLLSGLLTVRRLAVRPWLPGIGVRLRTTASVGVGLARRRRVICRRRAHDGPHVALSLNGAVVEWQSDGTADNLTVPVPRQWSNARIRNRITR